MFALFFHPGRSDDGRPVAMRVVAGQQGAATSDAPSPVIVDRVAAPLPDVQIAATRDWGSRLTPVGG